MKRPSRSRSRSVWFRRLLLIGKRAVRWCLLFILGYYLVCAAALLYLKWLPPLTTAVQMQRRVESFLAWKPYEKHYAFTPLRRISPHLTHAAVASEDARFFEHHGIDWVELRKVVDDAHRRGSVARGASTITQQLVKNLFLTTHRSLARKGVEFTLAPLAELMLSKERILELYVNVVEWGPGVYGAEAAARLYYGVSARDLSRAQAARLAACLPAPLDRTPAEMNELGGEVLDRMRAMGW